MSRKCELTGKKPLLGHNVSHSQRHTKRVWSPNLRTANIIQPDGTSKKMKVCMKALKTLAKPVRNRTKNS
jgi:large subunit ribosomal protein L28